MTSKTVASLVEGERDAWILVFPGADGATEVPGGTEALGEMLHGQAKVGRASPDLAKKFGVTLGDAPVLAVWPFRKVGTKRKASSFPGTEDGVAAAKKAALDTITDEYVSQINSGNADRWMQEVLMTTDTRHHAHLGPAVHEPWTVTSVLQCRCASDTSWDRLRRHDAILDVRHHPKVPADRRSRHSQPACLCWQQLLILILILLDSIEVHEILRT